MQVSQFKAACAAQGGTHLIDMIYFDNGRTFKRDQNQKYDDEIRLDEDNGLFYINRLQTNVVGDREFPFVQVEDIATLSAIIFVPTENEIGCVNRAF